MTSADLSTVTGQAFWGKALGRQQRVYSQAAHRQKKSWASSPHFPKVHANITVPQHRLEAMRDPMFATKLHDEMYRTHPSPDALRSNPVINNSTSQVQQALFGFRDMNKSEVRMFPCEYVSYHAMCQDQEVALRSRFNPRGICTLPVRSTSIHCNCTGRQVYEGSYICSRDRVTLPDNSCS